jgi:ATP-dependent DNA helicase PIF1
MRWIDEAPEHKTSNFKRSLALTNVLSNNDDSIDSRPTKMARFNSSPLPQLSDEEDDIPAETIVLSTEQQAVVDIALKGENIFMTGAAGSGKTMTLKAILRRLAERKVKFQVVAPTGIAALPLGGKTTYSFLGWTPESLGESISVLQTSAKKYVREAVRRLQVLIIEEISMVENQFLERMNLFLQALRENMAPFGGIQVIFLGDFHQLPPVKPFHCCLRCGRFMLKPPMAPVYKCENCTITDEGYIFTDSDKWAFKATVWKSLHLRMICLQQIHRQKAERFQDILNKIRHSIRLSDEEWHDLEKPKTIPHGIRPVKLMSLRKQVDEVNSRELAAIEFEPRTWECYDSYQMLDLNHISIYQPWETDQPLKDHKLPEKLELKIGAKVVLLINLEAGLVNGSQGEVIDFEVPAEQTAKEKSANARSIFDREQYNHFEGKNAESPKKTSFAPVVRFADGTTRTIPATTITTMYGTNQVRYRASRTQVPLALAWALSIHKSQGMTLDYVEVSSKHIFERGQLYVALSRGTSLEGLIVTGTSREQLEVDSDVVEFYENNEWEDLSLSQSPENSVSATGKDIFNID